MWPGLTHIVNGLELDPGGHLTSATCHLYCHGLVNELL